MSGETLKLAAIAGLSGVGCRVIDVGICPTPTVQLVVEEYGAAGGIVITASHNPAEWNALKFIGSEGTFLSKQEAESLWSRLEDPASPYRAFDRLGNMERFDGAEQIHIDKTLALSVLEPERIRSKRFRVVLDAVNGAAGKLCFGLLQALSCEVTTLHLEPTGVFGRKPEPLPESLSQAARLVAETKAAVGFALDPDGDRVALISDAGEAVGEEYTLALALAGVLEKQTGPVVMNLSTSLISEQVARSRGCPVHRSPVGEANVVDLMKKTGAHIGGEGNGGVILRELHLGRDSAVGIGTVLTLLAQRETSLSSIIAGLPKFFMVKHKITVPDPEQALGKLQQLSKQFESVTEEDGLKFSNENEWLHVRKSGTEPIVRIIAESLSEERTAELVGLARKAVGS